MLVERLEIPAPEREASSMTQTTTDAKTTADAAVLNGVKAPAKPKPAPKAAAKRDGNNTPAPTVRKAMTPKERAAKPVTATIAAYVEWLDKNHILGPKPMTAEQKRVAGISITLYGAYQTSPERRAARG